MSGLDWPGLMRMGMGPARLGGLGLAPSVFWGLTPAELALMLGIEAGPAAMTRERLSALSQRFPDAPRPLARMADNQQECLGGGDG